MVQWYDCFYLLYLRQCFGCLIKIDKEVLSSIVKISLATRRASAFGGRGGPRGRGGFRGRGKDPRCFTY